MTKPMKYRDMAKRLREAGFTPKPGKGDHEKWVYPGIERPVVVVRQTELSPKVTEDALKAIEKKKAEGK